jgi:hypothetical protein
MNKIECRELLSEIAAVDNRKVTQEMLDVWAEIVKHIPLDIALEAHKMARKSEAVNYLEPKHIVSFAKEAAYALDRSKPKAKEEYKQGDPMPKCRDHNKPILTCDPCCHRMFKYSQAQGYERIHAFAKAEIYG